ncbi:sensor histidine kinase [Microbacterium xanthum]|uniref:sensor histidine kinase n=1 Tax=Microbacterium xanthum TaxID=3079794 RepID=UPI002AD29885|nr:ATP-binding protein [Microbacterium sp. KSW-48]MDZ8172035.1 ATP-binding protein [Microbacterium sp. KSW-48]
MTSTSAPRRRRWSLQARLITAIVAVVALILVMVAIATSAVLGRVLQDNLNAQVQSAAQQTAGTLLDLKVPRDEQEVTASDVLRSGNQPQGTVLVLRGGGGGATTGAYVAGPGDIEELTDDQIDDVLLGVTTPEYTTVDIDGLGDYRMFPYQSLGYVAYAGMPESGVQQTVTPIITSVVLMTTGGLILLAAIVAWIVRRSLAPLRAVSATATRVANQPLAEGEVSITERVPADQTDEDTEIGRVGHALNTLLDHVDSSLDARQRNEERMRRFVADASHELRTPLASIRGFSELSLRAIRTQPDSPHAAETTEQSLERIQAQSVRMTDLVEDLLLLARLDEGQELVYSPIDVTQIAVEAVADARPAGPDHDWVLDVPDESLHVAGDAARLHQVVANLLANARTHTPAGTTVTVRVTRDGQDAVLSVHDDGPGVDPSIADELFERFSRADRSRARKSGGTGLGLSIAKAIVGAHGGRLSVRSEPGDTVFEVRIPARPTDPAARVTEPESVADHTTVADDTAVIERDTGRADPRQ